MGFLIFSVLATLATLANCGHYHHKDITSDLLPPPHGAGSYYHSQQYYSTNDGRPYNNLININGNAASVSSFATSHLNHNAAINLHNNVASNLASLQTSAGIHGNVGLNVGSSLSSLQNGGYNLNGNAASQLSSFQNGAGGYNLNGNAASQLSSLQNGGGNFNSNGNAVSQLSLQNSGFNLNVNGGSQLSIQNGGGTFNLNGNAAAQLAALQNNAGGAANFQGIGGGRANSNVANVDGATIVQNRPAPVVKQPDTFSQQVKQVALPVPRPVPVVQTRQIPVPVAVPRPVDVPRAVRVEVPQPVNVLVPRPYPVTVERKVPVPVKTPVYVKYAKPVPVEIPKPYPVVRYEKVHVPVPKPIYVEKQVPVKYIKYRQVHKEPVKHTVKHVWLKPVTPSKVTHLWAKPAHGGWSSGPVYDAPAPVYSSGDYHSPVYKELSAPVFKEVAHSVPLSDEASYRQPLINSYGAPIIGEHHGGYSSSNLNTVNIAGSVLGGASYGHVSNLYSSSSNGWTPIEKENHLAVNLQLSPSNNLLSQYPSNDGWAYGGGASYSKW